MGAVLKWMPAQEMFREGASLWRSDVAFHVFVRVFERHTKYLVFYLQEFTRTLSYGSQRGTSWNFIRSGENIVQWAPTMYDGPLITHTTLLRAR